MQEELRSILRPAASCDMQTVTLDKKGLVLLVLVDRRVGQGQPTSITSNYKQAT